MTLAASIACSGFARSLRFYTDVLGFAAMRYDAAAREAELEREGTVIELSERTETALGPLEYPFGRGITLLVWVSDIEAVYTGVEAYGARLHRPLEERWRDEDGGGAGHLAFEVADPDGYLLRFCQPIIGRR